MKHIKPRFEDSQLYKDCMECFRASRNFTIREIAVVTELVTLRNPPAEHFSILALLLQRVRANEAGGAA